MKGQSVVKILRDAQGMTVVEVLIAAGIVLVGLVAVMNAVSAGYLDVVASSGQSRATEYARQLLEQLKNQPFTPGPVNGNDVPSTIAGPDVGFARSWQITSTGAAPNQLATITVTVTWSGVSTRSQSVTLQTMRAEGT
jgi:Tfp pilus assembly protein PilV